MGSVRAPTRDMVMTKEFLSTGEMTKMFPRSPDQLSMGFLLSFVFFFLFFSFFFLEYGADLQVTTWQKLFCSIYLQEASHLQLMEEADEIRSGA